MNIFEKMQKLKLENKLTPKELQLTNFILNNKYQIKGMNMTELADKSKTSTGTLLRLSKDKLDLEGYLELKNIIISDLSATTVEVYYKDYKTRTGIIINQTYQNISELSEKQSNKIINYINDSKNILIFDPDELCKFSLSKRLTKIKIGNQYITDLGNIKATISHIISHNKKENKKYKEVLEETLYDNELVNKLLKKHGYQNLLISVLTEKIKKEDNVLLNYTTANNFVSIVFVSEDTKGLIENPDQHIVVDLNNDVGDNKLNDHHLSLSLYLKELLIRIQKRKDKN